MNPFYFVFLGLFLVCLVVRTGYELSKKSGRIDPSSKILFDFILAAMIALWISWFSMCPIDPFPVSLPAPVHWAGLGLVVLGAGLAIGALVQMKGVENVKRLVTTGLFSKVRHPMYIGFIFWIVGWSMYYGALTSFIFGVIAGVNILYWCRLEEDSLELQRGESYRIYRKHTWF